MTRHTLISVRPDQNEEEHTEKTLLQVRVADRTTILDVARDGLHLVLQPISYRYAIRTSIVRIRYTAQPE